MISDEDVERVSDVGTRSIFYLAIILGLAVSIGLLCVSLVPEHLGVTGLPILLRVIMGLAGGFMFFGSLFAIRHGLRVRHALRSEPVVPDHVEIEVDEGSDSTSYRLIAHVGDEIWSVPAYGGKGVTLIEQGQARDIRAWCDPNTGAPIAFSVNGERVATYPHATRR